MTGFTAMKKEYEEPDINPIEEAWDREEVYYPDDE